MSNVAATAFRLDPKAPAPATWASQTLETPAQFPWLVVEAASIAAEIQYVEKLNQLIDELVSPQCTFYLLTNHKDHQVAL